jgi:hypothetical protein
MRCEEIRERLIDFVYDEEGTSTAIAEMREHFRICSTCRRELEELSRTREYLQLWKDEAPLRNAIIAGPESNATRRIKWKYPRYAAIAAMLFLCILALANTRITWNKDGFSFKTQFIKGNESPGDYYTKSEVHDIVKRALDDSEFRMNETSYLRMKEMMDRMEQYSWMDLHLVRNRQASDQNKN